MFVDDQIFDWTVYMFKMEHESFLFVTAENGIQMGLGHA